MKTIRPMQDILGIDGSEAYNNLMKTAEEIILRVTDSTTPAQVKALVAEARYAINRFTHFGSQDQSRLAKLRQRKLDTVYENTETTTFAM